MSTDLKTKRSSRELSTTMCTHWQCWFCVSSALVVRSVILRFFSHGVLFVKFLCAPVFVCLKGPWAYVCAVSFDVIRCTLCSETVLRPSSWLPSQTSHRQITTHHQPKRILQTKAPQGAAGNSLRISFAESQVQTQTKGKPREIEQLSNVDYGPTNTQSSQNESQLYIFEDNEAVVKMIIKGWSPTMRHVSRTHRVALDRFVWQNQLGP